MGFWNRKNEVSFLGAMEDLEHNKKMTDENNTIQLKLTFDIDYASEEDKILADVKEKFNISDNVSEHIPDLLENIYQKDVKYFIDIWTYILRKYSHSMSKDDSYWIAEKVFGIFCYDDNQEVYSFIKENDWMQILLFNKNLIIERYIKFFIKWLITKQDYNFFDKILSLVAGNKIMSEQFDKFLEDIIENLESEMNEICYNILSKYVTNYKLKSLLEKYYQKYKENSSYTLRELLENDINKYIKINLDYKQSIRDEKIACRNNYDYTVVVLESKDVNNIEFLYYKRGTKVCILDSDNDTLKNILEYSSKVKLYCDMLNSFERPIFIKIDTMNYDKDCRGEFRNVNHIMFYLQGSEIIKSKPNIENSRKLYTKDGSFCDFIIPKNFVNQFEHRIGISNEKIRKIDKLDEKEINYIKANISKEDSDKFDLSTCSIYRIYYNLISKYPIYYEPDIDFKSLNTWRADYIRYFYYAYGYQDGSAGYYPSQYGVIVNKDNLDGAIFINDLNMYVMSNWEANIIRVLNYLKIKFEYEKKLITINNINYVPDIFLEDGTIIEIKGHWDNESLLKCYEYSQVNPNYYIIDSDFYYDIQKKYENLIEKWKHDKNILKAIKATVVGINFQGRKKYVENIKIGDKVFLKRDAENKFDKMAVKIEDVAGNQLGYLAKEWANIYARKLDIGMEFDSILREKNSNNLKIEIIRYNVDQEKMYKIFK